MAKNKFSDIKVNYLFVDNAAMKIITNPSEFDVILTENMFGDIITDEASVITGSLGMLPSASIGNKISLFEAISVLNNDVSWSFFFTLNLNS